MPRPLTVACLQTRPMPDFETASDEALGLAEEACDAGAEFLALPEYCGGLACEGAMIRAPAARDDDHPVVNALRDLAKRRGVWILIGSVAVPGPDGMIINRGFLVDPAGLLHGRYDKIHMFDIRLSESATYEESAAVAPGNLAVLHDTPFGRIGHTICYDLRFPHLYRDLALAGAEILAVPAAFTKKTGAMHWHVLNRARAIENGAFIVSPCSVGPVPGGGEAYGHSIIVDPMGKIVAEGGTDKTLVMATIDLDDVADARSRIPSLEHDRPYTSARKTAVAAE